MQLLHRALAVSMLVLATLPAGAAADPGDLDPSFGSGGVYTGQAGDAARVARDAQGRVLLATDADSGLRVTRLTAAGKPDATFGGGGTVIVDGGPGEPVVGATDIAALPDGRVVIVGSTYRTSSQDLPDPLIVRLKADGDYDNTFSGDGRQKTSLIGGESVSAQSGIQTLLLNADGSMFLGGGKFTTNGVQQDPQPTTSESSVLAKFTSSGVLDTSFGGGDGWVEYQRSTFGSNAFSAVVRESGGRLVALDDRGDFGSSARVVGFTASGALDTSFGGGDGVVPLDFAKGPQAYVQGGDLALDGAGRVVVGASRGGGGTPQHAAIARLLAGGDVDSTFGQSGVVAPAGLGDARAVAIGCADRVVAIGTQADTATATTVISRLLADGTADTSFGGGDGIAGGPDGAVPQDAAPDGTRLVAAGVTDPAPGKAYVASYLDTGACPGDSTVRLSASDATVSEGAGKATVTVQRSGATSAPASVHYQTTDGTATAPGDYTATTGTLSIPAGATSASFDVPIADDAVAEGDESFTVALSAASGATLGTPSSETVTVADDDLGTGTGSPRSPGNGGGGGGAPDTSFTSGPDGPTWIVQPTFGIAASVAGASFSCSLDGAAFAPCRTPYVTPPLTAGDHELRVAAVSPGGVADPTPAVRRFSINGPKEVSGDCSIDPFLNYGSFGGATKPDTCRIDFGGDPSCSSSQVCVQRPERCPEGAICTLTTTARWRQRGIDFYTLVYANSRLEQASPPLTVSGNYTHQCGTGDACSTRDVERAVGPAPSLSATCLARALPIYHDAHNALSVAIGGGSGGSGSGSSYVAPTRPPPGSGDASRVVRDLECSARLEIESAPPARLTALRGTTLSTFLPSAGKLVLSGSGGRATSPREAAARARAPFATLTKVVTGPGAVAVTPSFSPAARKTLARRHRLTVTVKATFTPSGGGAATTTTRRITLRPAPRRPRRCPARVTSRRKLTGCVARGLKLP